MLYFFCVRHYTRPHGEWYDVRTEDAWIDIIHEEDTPIEEGVFAACAWSATQQRAEQGPVWPIAKAFTNLEDAEAEQDRSKKREPDYTYKIVEVEARFIYQAE